MQLGPDQVMQVKEIRDKVVSYLPRYRLTGHYHIGTVAKAWQTYSSKIKVKDIITSCRTEEDVNFILKDWNIFSRLNFDELLDIAGTHRGIAKKLALIAKKMTKKGLDSVQLSEKDIMGSNFSEKLPARLRVKFVNLFKEGKSELHLRKDHLIHLAVKQECIALDLLDDPVISSRISSDQLALLGYFHSSVAEKIIATPSCRARLNGKQLTVLGRHLTVAQQMLRLPEVLNLIKATQVKMSGKMKKLSIITSLDELYANLVQNIKTEEQVSLIDGISGLCLIRMWHSDIAMAAVSGWHKEETDINHTELALLGLTFQACGQSIVEHILNNVEPKEGGYGWIVEKILTKHSSIFIKILENPMQRNALLRWELGLECVVKGNITLFKKILDYPELSAQITATRLMDRFVIAESLTDRDIPSLRELFDDRNRIYRNKMPGEWLYFIAKHDREINEAILQDAHLSQKLNKEQLSDLRLLTQLTVADLARLQNEKLYNLGRISPDVALKIVSSATLLQKLRNNFLRNIDLIRAFNHKCIAEWYLCLDDFNEDTLVFIAQHYPELAERILDAYDLSPKSVLILVRNNQRLMDKILEENGFLDDWDQEELQTLATLSSQFRYRVFWGDLKRFMPLMRDGLFKIAKRDPRVAALVIQNSMMRELTSLEELDKYYSEYLENALDILNALPASFPYCVDDYGIHAIRQRTMMAVLILKLHFLNDPQPILLGYQGHLTSEELLLRKLAEQQAEILMLKSTLEKRTRVMEVEEVKPLQFTTENKANSSTPNEPIEETKEKVKRLRTN